MRAFVQMRTLIDENKELKAKIESLENKYDKQFKVVFDAIKKLIQQPAEPKRKSIGFKSSHCELNKLLTIQPNITDNVL